MAKNISDDFNETAVRFLRREIDSPLLLAKYGLMLKFQAQGGEDKAGLVAILSDTALKALNARAEPSFGGYLGASDQDSLAALLKTLEAPDSAPLLPATTPAALAETGMKFVRCAEAARGSIDAGKFTDYARLCLDHAEKMRTLIDKRNDDMSLDKTITPVRRIVLKKDGL
jgi:hypothetical protein